MASQAVDLSKISVNLLLAVSIGFTGLKLGRLEQDLVRDLRDLKRESATTSKNATLAREDAEAALRDRVEQRSRIKVLEDWRMHVEHRYGYDFNYIHGRIQDLKWHPLKTPIPSITDEIPEIQ